MSTRYWLGVVSYEHVKNGVAQEFAQVCHGKKAPLEKLKAGDWLIYYSPKIAMDKPAPCKSFTAIGRVKTGLVYQVTMFQNFHPFRIDITYATSTVVPIVDVIDQLELTAKPSWGMLLRRGLLELSAHDFKIIAKHMGVSTYGTGAT